MEAKPPSTPKELFELHQDTCAKALSIMKRKNQDYSGGHVDVFANFRGSVNFGVEPEIGIMIRVQDKFKRLEAFVRNGTLAVKDEGVKDTVRDIINYTVLLEGMLMERAWKRQNDTSALLITARNEARVLGTMPTYPIDKEEINK